MSVHFALFVCVYLRLCVCVLCIGCGLQGICMGNIFMLYLFNDCGNDFVLNQEIL